MVGSLSDAQRLLARPGHALFRLRDRANALEDEALHAGACVGFRRVEVAL